MKTLDKNIHDISIVSSIALSIIPVLSIGIIPPKPRTSAFLQLYDENMNHTANLFPHCGKDNGESQYFVKIN